MTAVAAVSAALTLGVIAAALADNVGGFEIDASSTTGALYSGNEGGNDWAQGASQSGVFQLSAAAPHDVAGCYGFNIDKIVSAGASAFICDGNSDTAFKATMPERNIVSPSGKTPDDVWPIKAGNVRPKNDFSHAYANGVFLDSPCDADLLADDLQLRLGGHVGDNEGSHFWGFEFDRNAPGGFASLKGNGGASFNLDFNRVAGDLLISFTVPGSTADPVILDVFKVQNTPGQGQPAVFVPATTSGCPAAQPQGLTRLATNNTNDVKAPPWGVPACDPTATNASNSCRLVTGGAADNLLPPRDFAEATIDLTAFGILNPCITNVIFTSRSSHPLEGADIQDVGGGDFPLCGTKSGTKFNDLNADGDRDAGEPGIAGWPINLYPDIDQDGVLDANEITSPDAKTTNTIADDPATPNVNETGFYSFSNLGTGKFIVCEAARTADGWFQSAPLAGGNEVTTSCGNATGNATRGYAFTMSGSDHPNNDFGNFKQGTKSGLKYNDLNANGDRDAGEPTLTGWEIRAYTDANGNGIQDAAETTFVSTTTGAGGAYSFSLNPGKYVVCEVLQSTWQQSEPAGTDECTASGLGGDGYAITVTSGSSEPNNEFGNFQQGTKSGLKYNDLNANGDRDAGEPTLSGWEIRAYTDADNDGVLDAGETTFASDTTDANGEYSFSLNPGKYIVCEVLQTGWTQSEPGGADECSRAGLGADGYAITVTSGSTEPNNEFGNFQQGTKSGLKYNDLNANGDRDSGEPPLSGWVIRAYTDANNNGTLDSGENTFVADTTDGNGEYSFSLNPGKYIVCEVLQASWIQSEPAGAADVCASNSALGADGYAITVTSGSNEPNNEFGNYQNATKSGVKFNDLNANGTRDAGEPGLENWRIYVDLDDDSQFDNNEPSDLTDANGAYTIEGITPSSTPRHVREVLQTGWICSKPVPCFYTETFLSGDQKTGNDFGNYQNTSISGMKFKDADADGVKDAGETGLGGWTIHLFGPGGSHAADVTEADGTYSFGDLTPGSYVVCEEIGDQPNWVQRFPVSGSGDCTLQTFPGAVLADEGHAVTTTSGGSFGDRDFGNAPESTITVTFNPLADLPGGGDATEATDITCKAAGGATIGTTGSNTVTTDEVLTSASVVTCTVEFVDP